MDNLLFYTLLIALALYFFYYLPSQKKTSSRPDPFQLTTSTHSTQTDLEPTEKTPGSYPLTSQDQQELESTLDFLIKEMRDLEQDLDKNLN